MQHQHLVRARVPEVDRQANRDQHHADQCGHYNQSQWTNCAKVSTGDDEREAHQLCDESHRGAHMDDDGEINEDSHEKDHDKDPDKDENP